MKKKVSVVRKKKPESKFDEVTRKLTAIFKPLTPFQRLRVLKETERRFRTRGAKVAPSAEQTRLFD